MREYLGYDIPEVLDIKENIGDYLPIPGHDHLMFPIKGKTYDLDISMEELTESYHNSIKQDELNIIIDD